MNNDNKITVYSYTVGKVKVDLRYYRGNGQYSDGDVEDEILEALKNDTADKLLKTDTRWPVLYHLSPVRHHLLDGFNFKEGCSVLEIGCGCGAMSGILCQKAAAVEAVEISPRRAQIAAYRNKEYDNLTIHVGNLNDIAFDKKFDYVTLIGVLEYAGSFTRTDNPYKNFLENCRRFLKPDGTLIIAIENRLGMKYWSGAAEDHTGRRFDGITGYKNIETVKTFSRKELKTLLQSVGLTKLQWFYPYPDYKIPTDIFSDRFVPRVDDILEIDNVSYDSDRIELFSENDALITMLDAGLYSEFANSFLIFCQQENEGTVCVQPDYVHHSVYRVDDMRIGTTIIENNGKKIVRKFALNEASEKHIQNIVVNCQILSDLYGKEHVAQSRLIKPGVLEMEYIEGKTFIECTMEAVEEIGVEGFAEYLDFYCKHILRGSEEAKEFPVKSINSNRRKYHFDLHLGNIIIRNDSFVIIDYEWLVEKLPIKFMLFRVLLHAFRKYGKPLTLHNIKFEKIAEIFEIGKEDMKRYLRWEENFYNLVLNQYRKNYEKKRLTINFSK